MCCRHRQVSHRCGGGRWRSRPGKQSGSTSKPSFPVAQTASPGATPKRRENVSTAAWVSVLPHLQGRAAQPLEGTRPGARKGPENIMLNDRSQMQRATHRGFHLYETCRVGTPWRQKADSWLPGLGRVWGLMAKGGQLAFGVMRCPKMDSSDGYMTEYVKNHRVLHSKWVRRVVCEF